MSARWLFITIIAPALVFSLSGCPKDREPGFDPSKGLKQAPAPKSAEAPDPNSSTTAEARRGVAVKPGKRLERRGVGSHMLHKASTKQRVMRDPKKPPRLRKGIGFRPKDP